MTWSPTIPMKKFGDSGVPVFLRRGVPDPPEIGIGVLHNPQDALWQDANDDAGEAVAGQADPGQDAEQVWPFSSLKWRMTIWPTQ